MKKMLLIALLASPVLNADDTPKTQIPEGQPRLRATAPTSAGILRDQLLTMAPLTEIPNDVPGIVKLRKANLKQQLKIINQMVDVSDGATPRAVEQVAMLQIALMKLERNEMPTLNEKIKIQQKICETANQSKKRCMKKFEKLLIALPDFYQVEELVMESRQDLIQLQDKTPPKAS